LWTTKLRLLSLAAGLLVFGAQIAWGAPPKAAIPVDAETNTALADGLKTWNDLTQRLNHLQVENAAWEMRFNPEREDRNWWNPFWRSAAERNLQRSNELTLQIHALETQRTELESWLLETSQRMTPRLLETNAATTPAERELWAAVDAWRFPLWLRRLEEVEKSLDNLEALSPELQKRRRQTLELHLQIANTLDAYLTWRRAQPAGGETPAENGPLSAWQKQIQAWLATAQTWRRLSSE